MDGVSHPVVQDTRSVKIFPKHSTTTTVSRWSLVRISWSWTDSTGRKNATSLPSSRHLTTATGAETRLPSWRSTKISSIPFCSLTQLQGLVSLWCRGEYRITSCKISSNVVSSCRTKKMNEERRQFAIDPHTQIRAHLCPPLLGNLSQSRSSSWTLGLPFSCLGERCLKWIFLKSLLHRLFRGLSVPRDSVGGSVFLRFNSIRASIIAFELLLAAFKSVSAFTT